LTSPTSTFHLITFHISIQNGVPMVWITIVSAASKIDTTNTSFQVPGQSQVAPAAHAERDHRGTIPKSFWSF